MTINSNINLFLKKTQSPPLRHIWELPVNYPVFTAGMVICNYVDRIWRILVTPNFLYNIYDNKNYPDEPVNIHIQ